MIAEEVARKYAGAMFSSASDRNLLDQAYEQFAQLGQLLESDRTLLTFLLSPQVLDENKQSLVRDVFGSRMEPLFVEFLIVLLDKRRTKYLPEIIVEFNRLVEDAKGISRATVVTATPLAESEREQLKARLASRSGRSIKLETKVDRSILGGMIVMIDGEIIDGSVRHGLDLIEERLEKIRVH